MSGLRVLRPGLATSAQDLGVRGRAHLGVSRGGAFDMRSLALANGAVGNAPDAMGLEVLLQGPRLEAREPCVVAWCGAPFDVDLDGVALPPLVARPLAPGQVLSVGRCALGARCAIAFAGGLALERGAPLLRDACIALGLGARATSIDERWRAPSFASGAMVVHVTDATHSARFTAASRAAFFSEPFLVQPGSDRRGVRLRGPALEVSGEPELITEGVTLGAVQVTRSGEAIVLGVDQTTTGGYPKIAHVIAADAWLLGQLRPGASVRFERVDLARARELYLEGGACC